MACASPETEPLAPRLETGRLILRTPEWGDAGQIAGYHRHRSVADRVISIPNPCPPEHGSDWVRRVREAMSGSALLVWVIECRATGVVIGDCGLERVLEHRRGSLGYILSPDRWGEGLMTEALSRVLRYGFSESDPPLERIEADIYPDNTASIRLCERLGFRPEGVLRGYLRKDSAQRDVMRMSMIRHDP